MGKIIIDEAMKGKELTSFLMENKSLLIAQKKAIIKRTDPVECNPSLLLLKDSKVIKAAASDIPEDATSVRVKVVANTALYMDSQLDVLIPDCWKISIKQRKGMIPHLHDHIHEIGAEVGDVADIYSQDISLTDLGINKSGKTQCLIFETDIKKSYNEKVFDKYKAGRIKQHSIGLQYIKMDFAINDEDSEKEYNFWKKYFDQLINPEVAEERGFFFVIQEIKLLENSAVLFGSNELTPTLSVGKIDSLDLPGNAPVGSSPSQAFDVSKAIKETTFIKL
jgi:hypothetical protein